MRQCSARLCVCVCVCVCVGGGYRERYICDVPVQALY